jgi:hypothetical protein
MDVISLGIDPPSFPSLRLVLYHNTQGVNPPAKAARHGTPEKA